MQMWASVLRVRVRCVASRLWHLQLPEEGCAGFRDKVENQCVKSAVSAAVYAVICPFSLEFINNILLSFVFNQTKNLDVKENGYAPSPG